jgi:L-asparagine transporter-like permease
MRRRNINLSVRRLLSDNFRKALKVKLPVIIIAVLYFALLIFTMCLRIARDGVTKDVIQLAIVATAFALCSYIMFFYTKRRLQKRHVAQNTELEFEITGKLMILDKIIALLFLAAGVILMALTIL